MRSAFLRAWTTLVVLATVLGGVALPVLVAQSASAATVGLAKAGPTDPATGYPRWYQDSNGVRLEPCITTTGLCPLGAVLPDGSQPASVPGNFPDESFYYDATSTMDVANAANPVKATLTMAVEAAFGNVDGTIVPGDQITFSRIQVRVPSGLQPGATYRVTSPYGVDLIQADADGAIKPPKTPASRYEHGCGATPPDCDFGILLSGRVGPFLTSVGATPPPGYIGDGATPVPVTGSPFGTNEFRIDGPGIGTDGSGTASTKLFTLTGKLAGPIQANPTEVRFPGTDVSTPAAAQHVTITNLGTAPLTLTHAAMNTGEDFTADLGTCAGNALGRDDTCIVDVGFTPTAAGERSDLLVVNDGTSQVLVPVRGLGREAGTTPTVELSASTLAFADTMVGATSQPETTVLTNNGDAPLSLLGARVAGDPRRQFHLDRSDCPDVLAKGARCTLSVTFAPHEGGPLTASLVLDDDAADSPQQVALSGTAVPGLVATSPSVDPATGFPRWYEDSNGVRLQPCLDPGAPCPAGATLPDAGAAPSVPGNFPDEGFYFLAQSTMDLPAVGGAKAGKAVYVAAVEAAFGNVAGAVAPGEQITFSRIQVKVTAGLQPGATYTITDPYGTETIVADPDGGIKPPKTTASRYERGCGAVPPACDFGLLLGARIGPFLTQDRTQDPVAPPEGFLGDGATLQHVTGSPFGHNYFRIQGPNPVAGKPPLDLVQPLFTLNGMTSAGPSTPDLAAVSDTGSSATDDVTKATTLTFTGGALAQVPVTLYVDGSAVDTQTSDVDGSYSLTAHGVAEGKHKITATEQRPDGTQSPPSAARPVTVDLTKPAVGAASIFSTAPDSPGNTTTPFVLGFSEAPTSTIDLFRVATPAAGAAPVTNGCTGSVIGTGTGERFGIGITATVPADTGSDLYVRETDLAGNVGSCSATPVTYREDSVPPSAPTFIGASPSGTVRSASATFSFAGEAGVQFQCRLDGAAFGSCGATRTFASLAAGAHTVDVRALDLAGNAGPVASRTWTVALDTGALDTGALDTVAPPVSILAGPVGPTADATPAFAFSSPDPLATFACGVAPVGSPVPALTACTSPAQTRALGNGIFRFFVRSSDPAGNVTLTSRLVVVDRAAPSTPAALTAASASRSAIALSWRPVSDASTVVYRVYRDGSRTPRATVTGTGWTDTGLRTGVAHSYRVTAVDAAGNVSAQSGTARATPSRDLVRPLISVAPTVAAHGRNGARVKATVTWKAVDVGGIKSYALWQRTGSGAWHRVALRAATARSVTLLLAPGHRYAFRVMATDRAGNHSPRVVGPAKVLRLP